MLDDYNVMFKNILKRLNVVAPVRKECCFPTRIVIFEGEFSNNLFMDPIKLHEQGTKQTEKRWKK